jgi:signal transduction histidine kinase
MDTVREISHNLRPAVLDDFGLITALQREAREFTRLTHIPVVLRLPRQPDLHFGAAEETALFRIAQESLTNVVKHAKATQVRLELRCTDKEVRMAVADNGRGFSPEAVGRETGRPQLGLRSIRERVKVLGGRVEVTSRIGRGTKLVVKLPRRKEIVRNP